MLKDIPKSDEIECSVRKARGLKGSRMDEQPKGVASALRDRRIDLHASSLPTAAPHALQKQARCAPHIQQVTRLLSKCLSMSHASAQPAFGPELGERPTRLVGSIVGRIEPHDLIWSWQGELAEGPARQAAP